MTCPEEKLDLAVYEDGKKIVIGWAKPVYDSMDGQVKVDCQITDEDRKWYLNDPDTLGFFLGADGALLVRQGGSVEQSS